MQTDYADQYDDIIVQPLIKPIAGLRGPWSYITIVILLVIMARGGHLWGGSCGMDWRSQVLMRLSSGVCIWRISFSSSGSAMQEL